MGGDLSSAPRRVDLLVVGCGLSGSVLAERCSKELGMTSLIIDCRNHIGGNCYDYVEEHGLRASKYHPSLKLSRDLPPARSTTARAGTALTFSTPNLAASGTTCRTSRNGSHLTIALRVG